MSQPETQTPATESADGDREITLETTFEAGTGNYATLLKDDHGRLAYPGYVPRAAQSPPSPAPPDPSPGSGLRKTTTDPEPGSEGHQTHGKTITRPEPLPQAPPRPKLSAKAATDAPSQVPGRGQSSALAPPPPAIRRAGTNISELQQALWATSYSHDTSSSDSSTDDDRDEDDDYADLDADVDRTDQAANVKATSRSQQVSNNQFRRFQVGNENYKTKGKVSKRDGRLAISIKDLTPGYLPKALGGSINKVVPLHEGETSEQPGQERPSTARASSETIVTPESFKCPPMNIVIMVIGSRGDAQPFLKIGKVLKEQYGHRVRIATHPAFRDFIEKDSDLEFFSVGGDPSELMAFMVKNPGLIPTLETVRAGDIGRRRSAMAEMFDGFWRACISATDDEKDTRDLRMMGEKQPFIADAIIANPASFAHVHCAEALGIPLVLSFTFPYSPTRAFPHPLASIKKSNVDPGYSNLMSYPLVEMMVWQGLGDLVNDLRVKTLGLDPVSTLWAPGALYRMNVPFSYLWSPSLVPKPADWGEEIDVSGFVFLDLASSFSPPSALAEFLNEGDQPIYIGFGSIVVDDADKFTEMIFEAIKLAGVRALVSKGWGGLGAGSVGIPEGVFMLENTPHDWLFPQVAACVIHGGAGTTAIALKCGKPIMIVPFFGDQFFWGSMIGKAKAGPEAVPYKRLTAEKLAEGIKFCLTEEARTNAQRIARNIASEGDGAANMCAFFHQNLKLSGTHSMRCSILEDRVAVWNMKGSRLRLSALAADILVEKGHLQWRKLRPIRHCEWNDFEGPGEPVTGVLGTVAGTVTDVFGSIGGVPGRMAKVTRKRRERKDRRRKKAEQAKRPTQDKTSENGHATASPDEPKPVNGDRKVTQDTSQETPPQPQDTSDSDVPVHDGGDPERASLSTATTPGTHDESGYADEVGRGALDSARAIASAPVDLSVALAQGFHNAPRLYGDDTVRRPYRVTGYRSGLRAARGEFAMSIYDAWTGLVRLPVRGAKNGGGVKGFTKGVGMGLTGLVLKDLAAVFGPVGYTLKGIKKQVERRRQPSRKVRRARILQGQREASELSAEERKRRVEDVLRGWDVLSGLWEAVESNVQKESRLGAQWRRKGTGEAFESVPLAEHALTRVREGDRVTRAVKEYRESEDLARRSQEAARGSTDKRRSHTKGLDRGNVRGEQNEADLRGPIAEGDGNVPGRASVLVQNGKA